MSTVRIKLKYEDLAPILEREFNQKKIEFKSNPISIQDLLIRKEQDLVFISSMIKSKWNASFTLSSSPSWNQHEQKLEIENLDISLDTSNIIFKGILKIIKSNVLKRIEKIAEEPLENMIKPIKAQLDLELNKTKLPYDLELHSTTESIDIKNIEFNKDHLFLELDISQNITIQLDSENLRT